MENFLYTLYKFCYFKENKRPSSCITTYIKAERFSLLSSRPCTVEYYSTALLQCAVACGPPIVHPTDGVPLLKMSSCFTIIGPAHMLFSEKSLTFFKHLKSLFLALQKRQIYTIYKFLLISKF